MIKESIHVGLGIKETKDFEMYSYGATVNIVCNIYIHICIVQDLIDIYDYLVKDMFRYNIDNYNHTLIKSIA